jgi:hypothetical protein
MRWLYGLEDTNAGDLEKTDTEMAEAVGDEVGESPKNHPVFVNHRQHHATSGWLCLDEKKTTGAQRDVNPSKIRVVYEKKTTGTQTDVDRLPNPPESIRYLHPKQFEDRLATTEGPTSGIIR